MRWDIICDMFILSECLYPHQLCEQESRLTRDLPRDLGDPL